MFPHVLKSFSFRPTLSQKCRACVTFNTFSNTHCSPKDRLSHTRETKYTDYHAITLYYTCVPVSTVSNPGCLIKHRLPAGPLFSRAHAFSLSHTPPQIPKTPLSVGQTVDTISPSHPNVSLDSHKIDCDDDCSFPTLSLFSACVPGGIWRSTVVSPGGQSISLALSCILSRVRRPVVASR